MGYEKHDGTGKKTANSRNGSSPKTLKSEQGDITVEVPRDRSGEFEPMLVKKRPRRFSGFDDKIISMYSRGMTARDIESHLLEIYGTEVSPEFISTVTNSVMEEVREWQNRPSVPRLPYPLLGCVDVEDTGVMDGFGIRPSILRLALTWMGKRRYLALWVEQTEGAKFWRFSTSLRAAGLEGCLRCLCGWLKRLS